MNDWGLFTSERYREVLEKFPSDRLPSQEWVTSNRNKIVSYIAYLKLFFAVLFTLGDFSSGVILITFAVLRWLFYFNPIFDQKRESQPQSELLDESDPLEDGPKFVLTQTQNDWYVERCLIELQLTLVMVSAFLVVITSTKFGPSAWLRRIKRIIRRNLT